MKSHYARSFALVDCNNFYVSCERIFQPSLEEKPVIVLSNNDGCVISRSSEVKKLQIPMGAPVHQIKNLIEKHKIKVFSSNFALYGDISRRVMQTLAYFASHMEVYSIDEAFLDTTGIENVLSYGKTIRKTLCQWTGIPVSIGFGSTKTLAKIANYIAKKGMWNTQEGVFDLTHHIHMDSCLESIAVEDIWGIGQASANLLKSYNISTAQHLKETPLEWIRYKMGIVGVRLVQELRGISTLALEQAPPTRKSLIISRSFKKPLTTFEELKTKIAQFSSRAAEKLRHEKLAASAICISIRTSPFGKRPKYTKSTCIPLLEASNDTRKIIKAATTGLAQLFLANFQYKKAGITLMKLVPETQIQKSLFSSESDSLQVKEEILNKTMDKINRKLGPKTLQYGAAGTKNTSIPERKFTSPPYTTNWNHLPNVS
ncbi:MAG: Y-family DNA polymerase [Alphaproteobacteria bacterium]|nr:Y-family DNA polymerase [Alphaproteobacteria bacterium]MBT5390591.1 Y-family DNA polymerase [Alphaproteobacteria bacterium]MBT5655056.1 Y-family DNA polymerase [Alphaproteobacteria bacterium]